MRSANGSSLFQNFPIPFLRIFLEIFSEIKSSVQRKVESGYFVYPTHMLIVCLARVIKQDDNAWGKRQRWRNRRAGSTFRSSSQVSKKPVTILTKDFNFLNSLVSRLLHSKSKDSEAQLKALLDDCIRQRRSGASIAQQTAPQVLGRGRAADSEAKNLDRIKRDLAQLVPTVINKRPKLDSMPNTTYESSASYVIDEDDNDMAMSIDL